MAKAPTASRTYELAVCGLSIALLTVASWITVPLGPVPFTLQTFMLVFIVAALTPRQTVISVLGYLALGALGAPVFAGMAGGAAQIMGPSGGFLIGFGLGTLLAALLLAVWPAPAAHPAQAGPAGSPSAGKRVSCLRECCAALIVMAASYLCGWLQFMAVMNVGPIEAFAMAIAPFIVLDLIKAALAVSMARTLKAAVPALRDAASKPRA